MNIRINNFNLNAGILTIHDGKGKKDRTLPLPVTIMPEIDRQLEIVRGIHRQDLEEGASGVFMFESIEKKYKNAEQEFHWQWFLLAKKVLLIFRK